MSLEPELQRIVDRTVASLLAVFFHSDGSPVIANGEEARMTRFKARPATAHPADIDAARVAQSVIDNLPAHVAEAAEKADDPESVVREWLFSGGLHDPECRST